MSAVRVQYGSATVELGSDDFTYSDGETLARYAPLDLIRATLQALASLHDDSHAQRYREAIQNGLDREGLAQ